MKYVLFIAGHFLQVISQYDIMYFVLAVRVPRTAPKQSISIYACNRNADTHTLSSGEESEAKKIVASMKKHAFSEARRFEKGGKDDQEIEDHDSHCEDASAPPEDGHETDITQYSSESSDSTQRTASKVAKSLEREDQRRRSTRAQGGGKKTI